MYWAQIVVQSVNFQLVEGMDKMKVEESFSYIIVLQGNSIIYRVSFNLCIFVWGYGLYLSIKYLWSRDFKGIKGYFY